MKYRLAGVIALTAMLAPWAATPVLANGEEAPPPPPPEILPPPPPPSIAGPYIGVMGGGNYVESREVEWFAPGGGCGVLCLIDQDVSYDWGWGAGGTIGYRSDYGVRAEIEGVYRENEHDEWHILGLNIPFDDGDITVISGMVNVLYDIDFGSVIVPYVGVGVGAAYVDVEADLISGNPFDFEDTAWAFAYQGIAGVNVRLDENIDLFADYRYFSTYDLELEDNYLPPPILMTRSDDEYSAHSVFAGLRFTFTDMAMDY